MLSVREMRDGDRDVREKKKKRKKEKEKSPSVHLRQQDLPFREKAALLCTESTLLCRWVLRV